MQLEVNFLIYFFVCLRICGTMGTKSVQNKDQKMNLIPKNLILLMVPTKLFSSVAFY